MATASFGRRNVVRHASPVRSNVSAPRRAEADTSFASQETSHTASSAEPAKSNNIFVGSLVLIGFAVLMLFVYFSDLRRDIGLQDTFRPDVEVAVEHANCRRYLLLVTHCSVGFSWQAGPARLTTEGYFLVSFRSMGGLPIIPMRSSADPTVVTSSVALEHISNRLWTLLLVPGFCVMLGVLMLMNLKRGRI